MKSAVLFVALTLCVFTDGFAQIHRPKSRQAPTEPASETIPSIQTQTAKVLKSPTWDYMIWADASEKKHFRAKLLTANEATVQLANLEGTTVTVPVLRFSKADRELIDRYTAKETAILSTDADHHELTEAIKIAMTSPDDTSIRRKAESEKRQAEFLKRYNGTPFVLCFPISDITDKAIDRDGRNKKLPVGQYHLQFGEETIWAKPTVGAGSSCSAFWPLGNQAIVRLTASQAAWVNKGDKLIVKGTADFTFKSGAKRVWLSWGPR